MTQASRKTAPEGLSPVPFNIPQPASRMLSNGLKVVAFEDRRLPLVSYRLAFLSGDASDGKEQIGVTSAMASMLTEGTANYSSRELAEKVERLGAGLHASASDDFVIVAASALSIYSSDIQELLAEIIFRPTFPEEELDLYRRNAVENLKYQRSQPNFLANEQTARILYGEHPYARISPNAQDVEKLSRDLLAAAHTRVFVPNGSILVAVGDLEPDTFFDEIEERFGQWQSAESTTLSLATPPEREKRTLTIVDRPGSAQANIVLAVHGINRTDPDFFAASVMNQVLGAGASSRVFMNLREEKGYTYGAYTRLDMKRLAGDFEATAEVRTAVTGDSLREFFYELERIRDEVVSDQELADAKNFLTGVFPIRAETQEGLTNLILNQQLYDLPADYLQTYRDNVDAVTSADVQRVAKRIVLADRVAMVIVGDAGEVLPQTTSYATDVEIFDTDGNPLDVASFKIDPNAATADVAGKWDLVLDFQGQKVPVKLTLEQDGEIVSGTIDTALGSGKIEEGSVKGSKLTATARTDIQGQSVDFVISGSVESGVMKGTLAAAIIPDSLPFEGTRAD